MSYDMDLMCRDNEGELTICTTGAHTEGATYCVGGSNLCSLNITGNYTRVFNTHQIDGMTGAESLPILQAGIDELGTDQSDNYWDPTPGNVGHMLSILAKWATEHPDAVWRDDG